jgi:hypothetical protein
VTILTYAERQRLWNWCREFIDREAIYRVDAPAGNDPRTTTRARAQKGTPGERFADAFEAWKQ